MTKADKDGKLKETVNKSNVEGLVMPDGIEKGEWLKRCAARFIEVAGVQPALADQFAETCLESTIEFDDWEITPEDSADEEMSYWRD